MADSQMQSEESVTEIGECLEPYTVRSNSRGVYAILKRWYWHAFTQAPNPSRTDMEKVRGDFHNLYQRDEPQPSGLPLSTHADHANLNNKVTSESEVESGVIRLRPHRLVRHTHLRAEHFKQWQREAYPGEKSKTSTCRDRWMCLIDLVQHMWRTGKIP